MIDLFLARVLKVPERLMESYQFAAIAVMIAMGVVVNSTMKLNNYRKTNSPEFTIEALTGERNG